MQLDWKCKSFAELSSHELYTIMRLRSEVFVVEQNCVYQDADNKDQKCFHLMGWVEDELAAYSRLLPANVSYSAISIGRVVTSPLHRSLGVGKALTTTSINSCYELFGKQPIKIGAQQYLKKFYEGFGFAQVSEVYLEDNIPHIEMLKD